MALQQAIYSGIYRRFVAITPSDTVQYGEFATNAVGAPTPTEDISAIWVGTGGTVALAGSDNVSVSFGNVASGTIMVVSPRRIMSTGTGASNIVALFA